MYQNMDKDVIFIIYTMLVQRCTGMNLKFELNDVFEAD